MGLEIINKLKKEKGLTNEALSLQSGVPLGTLSKITSGITKDPKLETLKALARVLGCKLDDFDDTDNSQESIDPKEVQLVENYKKLNSIAKNKLVEYSDDLIQISKYQKEEDNKETENEVTATKEDNIIELPKESKKLKDISTTIAAHDDDLTSSEKEEMDKRILEFLNNKKN